MRYYFFLLFLSTSMFCSEDFFVKIKDDVGDVFSSIKRKSNTAYKQCSNVASNISNRVRKEIRETMNDFQDAYQEAQEHKDDMKMRVYTIANPIESQVKEATQKVYDRMEYIKNRIANQFQSKLVPNNQIDAYVRAIKNDYERTVVAYLIFEIHASTLYTELLCTTDASDVVTKDAIDTFIASMLSFEFDAIDLNTQAFVYMQFELLFNVYAARALKKFKKHPQETYAGIITAKKFLLDELSQAYSLVI